eukprot:3318021-Alexandrium_andersonii.AAC.1
MDRIRPSSCSEHPCMSAVVRSALLGLCHPGHTETRGRPDVSTCRLAGPYAELLRGARAAAETESARPV